MKRRLGFSIFGFAAILAGNAAYANENTTISYNLSGQSCLASDNRICDAVTNELMKELIKQTVYTVGSQVLNKLNQTNTAVPVQATTPVPVYYTPAPAAATTTTVPVTTTTTTTSQTPSVQPQTNTTAPQEEMIIIQ